MSYLQVRDLIHKLVSLHQSLASFYRERSSVVDDHTVGRLLDHCADRAETASRTLGEPNKNALLEHWLQYDPVSPIKRQLNSMEVSCDADADDVLSDAMAIEGALVMTLDLLEGTTGAVRLKELFRSLRLHQQTRLRGLARARADLELGVV